MGWIFTRFYLARFYSDDVVVFPFTSTTNLYIVNHFLNYFFAFFLASVFLTINYFSSLSFFEIRQDVVLMSKIIFVKFWYVSIVFYMSHLLFRTCLLWQDSHVVSSAFLIEAGF